MNYLALCQRLRSEAGLAGTGPSTTAGQLGELGRVVGWIDDAYQSIQDSKRDWSFLRFDFSLACVSGTSVYPSSTVSELANWKTDSLRCYFSTVNDEQYIRFVPWDEFRDTRLLGSNRVMTGRPIEFSIKPDNSLVLWPIPDNTYTIDGEYYRVAHIMALDTDVPLFDRNHMVIVYDALMRAASYLADPAMYANAQKQHGILMNRLTKEKSPVILTGRTLA